MKKLLILCSLLFTCVICSTQTLTCPVGNTCNIVVTGPTQTSGPVKITLEINPPIPQADDMLTWALPLSAFRTSQHINGAAVKYFWLDGDRFFWEKGSLGNPQDIESYDNNFIYHWVTEDGDSADTAACVAEGYTGGCFGNGFAYKRWITPVSIIPRHFDTTGASGDVTIIHPSPNMYIRTTNCEVDAQPHLNLGNVVSVTHFNGPTAFGGAIGTQNAVVQNYYYALSSTNPPYQSGNREQLFLVKGIGQVEWTNAHWDAPSSSYVITQTSLNNNIVSGGAPVPFVPCGPGSSWWPPYTQTNNNTATLSSVAVSPSTASINVSTSTTFTGIGTYSDTSTANITNGLRWTSSNTGVATVNFTRSNPQTVTCTSTAGTVTITATDASGQSGTASLTCNAAAPPCAVSISPNTATIIITNTQTFTPTTTNCTPSTVFWQVNGITGGNSTVGTITTGGVYTAPTVIPSPSTVTIKAVSNADNTKTASASVTIIAPNCGVTISPTTTTILVGVPQTFTPTITGCIPNTVHWQVNGITGGNGTIGTITTGGIYTAPSNVPTPNIVTVAAISDQDNTTNATATVTIVAPLICGVSIVPLLNTINTGSTFQFTGTTTQCSPSTIQWQVNGINGGNSTVGTISVTGLYTAPSIVPSPNVVTVSAVSNADPTKVASATVTITTPTVSIMDKYEQSGDVCTFGAMDSFAHLPTSCYYTNPAVTTSTGTVRNATAATWTSVWTATQCNDIVEITAGTTIQGNLTIPTKTCTKNSYITLRTSAHNSLPAYGTKVTPCFANVTSIPGYPYTCTSPTSTMAKILGTGTGTPLKIAINTRFLKIEGIEITRNPNTGLVSQLIDWNSGGTNHIILDHVWLHGTTNTEVKTALLLSRVSFIAFLDSYTSDIHCISVTGSCTDAKVIGGGTNIVSTDNDNTFKIVNNFISASGENTLLGGSTAVIIPTDFEYRVNYYFKPKIWNPSDPSYNGGVGGHAYITKNLFELKNGVRLLVEGNTFENVWAGFTQQGFAVLLTPKNQSGTQCPICAVTDVTFRYNKIRTAWAAFQIQNISDAPNTYATAGNSYSIHDNSADNLQYNTCFQCTQSTSTSTIGNALTAPTSFILNHVNINHNTFVFAAGSPFYAGSMLGLQGATAPNSQNFIDFQNNIISSGFTFFASNSSGLTTSCSNTSQVLGMFTTCWLNNVVTGNTVLPPLIQRTGGAWTPHVTTPPTVSYTGSTITFPLQTCLSETSQGSIFVNYNNGLNGDYHVKNTSSCHNTANDATDPGANQNLVNSNTSTSTQF